MALTFTDAQRRAMNKYKQGFINKLNSLDIAAVLGLQRAAHGGYICPVCGDGSGADGTGVKIRTGSGKQTIACYKSGCFKRADARGNTTQCTDLLGALQIITGGSIDEVLKAQFPDYDITIPLRATGGQPERAASEGATPRGSTGSTDNAQGGSAPATPGRASAAAAQDTQADYTGYYKACFERLGEPAAVSYLEARGISLETARRYGLGFDPQADPASAPGAMGSEYRPHKCPRIIIPTTKAHYIGRSIDPATPKQYAKTNVKGGKPHIFNLKALYNPDAAAVFVVEGAFDALSVAEAGGQAIALNSTSNTGLLIDELKQKRTGATLVLCLDNDAAGAGALNGLESELNSAGVSYIKADINGSYKDANEHLTGNRDSFIKAVQDAQAQILRPHSIEAYINDFMALDIMAFQEANKLKTGFENLDEKAGGIYAGLYCIAAISSLGKTTFATQIADNLAAAGKDVLYFSLEQSKLELATKGIARLMASEGIANAPTSLDIRKGNLTEAVIDAANRYTGKVGNRLSVIEGNFDCDITFIGNYTRDYIRKTGKRPVIMVDYLQILRPPAEATRQERRETVDIAITELKRISRELSLPVFVISAVNRANYLAPIDFESLKESGGIEYTSDVVWGLQLQCLNDPVFDQEKQLKKKRETIKAAKAATPRKIELCCLKNRYGATGFSCYFNYYPAHDLFVPAIDPDEMPTDNNSLADLKKRLR